MRYEQRFGFWDSLFVLWCAILFAAGLYMGVAIAIQIGSPWFS